MHLRAIKLRGFKSFPEPVEVRLEPGVAVVVGPNGSGKSNVSDAIVWAAGSMAPTELRAEKPDDATSPGPAVGPETDPWEAQPVSAKPDGKGPVATPIMRTPGGRTAGADGRNSSTPP